MDLPDLIQIEEEKNNYEKLIYCKAEKEDSIHSRNDSNAISANDDLLEIIEKNRQEYEHIDDDFWIFPEKDESNDAPNKWIIGENFDYMTKFRVWRTCNSWTEAVQTFSQISKLRGDMSKFFIEEIPAPTHVKKE